jgi:hypothetical protein
MGTAPPASKNPFPSLPKPLPLITNSNTQPISINTSIISTINYGVEGQISKTCLGEGKFIWLLDGK